MEKQKKSKIDFKELKFKDLEGNEVTANIAKDLGNLIYRSTPDLGMLEVAQKIYKDGEVELDDNSRQQIVGMMKHKECPFIAVIKKKVIEELEK